MGTADAAAALLRRFTFTSIRRSPTRKRRTALTTASCAPGEDAIDPVRSFAGKAESLAWPMQILKALLDEDAFVEELLLWLSRWDTEYASSSIRRSRSSRRSRSTSSPRFARRVERFLEDVNEPARFHAVATTLAQDDDAALPALLDALGQEESVRVKNKIADGLVARGWRVPADGADAVRKALPPGYVARRRRRELTSSAVKTRARRAPARASPQSAVLADLCGFVGQREAERDRDHLVELEGLVLRVDLAVREVVVRAGAARVEAGAVPGERERAVLDAEREEVAEVEVEPEAERRRDGRATRR